MTRRKEARKARRPKGESQAALRPGARGGSGFEAYYAQLYEGRWEELRAALLHKPAPVARLNPHFSRDADRKSDVPENTSVPNVPEGCAPFGGTNPERDVRGLLAFYVLDAASVYAARVLDVHPGERVLDLCAAPGGKTLILADALVEGGELVANDRSSARAKRLRRVVEDYLPESLQSRVRVTSYDAKRWGMHEPGAFDAVLLDAPCSSEAHVLADPQELAKWSPGRIKRLAKEQYALLTSALLAVRPGGRVVYSTCSIAPDENDGVIERLFEKGRHPVRAVPVEVPVGTRTRYGWQILPDRDGCGPIYVALLTKPV